MKCKSRILLKILSSILILASIKKVYSSECNINSPQVFRWISSLHDNKISFTVNSVLVDNVCENNTCDLSRIINILSSAKHSNVDICRSFSLNKNKYDITTRYLAGKNPAENSVSGAISLLQTNDASFESYINNILLKSGPGNFQTDIGMPVFQAWAGNVDFVNKMFITNNAILCFSDDGEDIGVFKTAINSEYELMLFDLKSYKLKAVIHFGYLSADDYINRYKLLISSNLEKVISDKSSIPLLVEESIQKLKKSDQFKKYLNITRSSPYTKIQVDLYKY